MSDDEEVLNQLAPSATVFISYSHESLEHAELVRTLWLFLRQCGIDARIDILAAQARRDWALWTADQIRTADYILVVASPEYKRRAEGQTGEEEGRGVQWEARLIRDYVYAHRQAGLRRVIPVVLPGGAASDLPDYLGPASSTVYELSSFTIDGAERLIRLLTGQPGEAEPALGQKPVLPIRDHALAEPMPTGASSNSSAGESERARSRELGWLAAISSKFAWPHGIVPVEPFVGRETELQRLSKWARNDHVRLIGVISMGGSGKTALVTHWLSQGIPVRPGGFAGVFGWSFYENSSEEEWATSLVAWCEAAFGYASPGNVSDPGMGVLHCLANCPPILLVLDGLEVRQLAEEDRHGDLVDGPVRTALIGLCRMIDGPLAILTSRIRFADLEIFGGSSARMIEIHGLTVSDGAALLDVFGGRWLDEDTRKSLVRLVSGHALGTTVLGVVLRERGPTLEIGRLRRELADLGSISARIGRLLDYYARTLPSGDRNLIAIVSVFRRPIEISTVLALGTNNRLSQPLRGWTPDDIVEAIRQRLSGLLTWSAAGTITAHPIIRDHFRRDILSPLSASAISDAALVGIPSGPVRSREAAEIVAEAIELLVEADQWAAADDLYRVRSADGWIWLRLPALRLGLRAASAFVEPSANSRKISALRANFYMNEVGLFASKLGQTDSVSLLDKARRSYSASGLQACANTVSRSIARHMMTTGASRDALSEAKALERNITQNESPVDAINTLTVLAAAYDLVGNSEEADKAFIEANAILRQATSTARNLYSGNAISWAVFLMRTGRERAAGLLTLENLELCEDRGWLADAGRCETVLARHNINNDNSAEAITRLRRAERIFRDGELLPDLAVTLNDLAECQRRIGNYDHALESCTESLRIATSCQTIPTVVKGLSIRVMILIDQGLQSGLERIWDQASDDADHALRLVTGKHRLPWSELVSAKAVEYMHAARGNSHTEGLRSEKIFGMLCPAGLASNPIAAGSFYAGALVAPSLPLPLPPTSPETRPWPANESPDMPPSPPPKAGWHRLSRLFESGKSS